MPAGPMCARWAQVLAHRARLLCSDDGGGSLVGINELGPGRWQVVADLGRDSEGRRRRKTRVVHGGRRDAERAEAELRRRSSTMRADGARTVRDLLDTWLNVRPGRLAGTTLAEYRRLADKRIIPALGEVPVGALEPWMIEDFCESMLDEGLSAGSARKAHGVIRRAYTLAMRWGWCDDNPGRRAEAPTAVRFRVDPPSDETVGRLMRVCDADERGGLGVAVRVAAMAGLRRGEVLALSPASFRWVDADGAQAGELVVERAVEEVRRGGVNLKAPKSNQTRVVPVPGELARVLDIWAGVANARAIESGLPGAAFLFSPAADHSRVWTPSAWSTRWRRARAEADAVPVRFHDLRHWYATALLDDGVPEVTVAAMMGHESLDTLRKVYAHRVDSTARRAADGLGRRFA